MGSIVAKEILDWSSEELSTNLAEYERKLLKLRFDNASKGLERPLEIRETRRDIARLKTELRSRAMKQTS